MDAATIVGVLVATVGSFAAGRLVAFRATKWKIRRAKVVNIADAPEGVTVRITGIARADEAALLVAPISGRACAIYDLRFETLGEVWEELIAEHAGVVFAIDDGTGQILVDPAEAELALEHDQISGEVRQADLTARDREILGRHQLLAPDSPEVHKIRERSIRSIEGVIAIGSRVTVVGAGIREAVPGEAGDNYREAATRLRFSASRRSPLLVSNDPKLAREPAR